MLCRRTGARARSPTIAHAHTHRRGREGDAGDDDPGRPRARHARARLHVQGNADAVVAGCAVSVRVHAMDRGLTLDERHRRGTRIGDGVRHGTGGEWERARWPKMRAERLHAALRQVSLSWSIEHAILPFAVTNPLYVHNTLNREKDKFCIDMLLQTLAQIGKKGQLPAMQSLLPLLPHPKPNPSPINRPTNTTQHNACTQAPSTWSAKQTAPPAPHTKPC